MAKGYRWAKVSTPHLYAQYLQGVSLRQLGRMHGISFQAVRARFVKAGLARRGIGRRLKNGRSLI